MTTPNNVIAHGSTQATDVCVPVRVFTEASSPAICTGYMPTASSYPSNRNLQDERVNRIVGELFEKRSDLWSRLAKS